VAQSDSAHAMALAEARQQVLHISDERDAARNRANDQKVEIDDLRVQLQKLKDELGQQTLDVAEREELKRQIAEMTANRDSHLEREKGFLAETISQQERLAQLTEQLAAAQRGREETLTSLTAAQKQIDEIIRERDQVRQQGVDDSIELEAQVVALRSQFAEYEKKSAEADKRLAAVERERDVALDKVNQAEKQRLMTIDLATQLDNAKRDLLQLSADLAEARLQAEIRPSPEQSRRTASATAAPAGCASDGRSDLDRDHHEPDRREYDDPAGQ
jgi:chromosome segregation ATPase